MILLNGPDSRAAHRIWTDAHPFPHIVLPDAIYEDEAAALAAEFPNRHDSRWHVFSGPLESGKQEGNAALAGPLVAEMHNYLASDTFVEWLRDTTRQPDLIPDPTRHGGGIHQSGPFARLGMHTDFDLHPDGELARAVNLILFVGDTVWQPEWGGLLYLGEERDVTVLPSPGTLVIFEASPDSWHGHPIPMRARSPLRRSIPAYYYRPATEAEKAAPRSTRFLEVERGRCPHDWDNGQCGLCGAKDPNGA